MARAAAAPAPSPGLRRLLALAGAVIFLDTIFYTAITPLLPGYVHRFGFSHAEAGLLTASYPVGTLAASVPAALLGARFGVRPALVASLSLFAASSLAFGLAGSAEVLVGARFAQGVSGAVSWGAALGWVAGGAPAARRGQALGITLSAATAGTIVGPAVGSLAAAVGTKGVFGGVAVLALVLLGVVLAQRSAPAGEPVGWETVAAVATSRTAWAGAWLFALFGLFGGALALIGPLELNAAGAGATAIGLVFLLAALGELGVSPLAGRAADRRGPLYPVQVLLPLAAVTVTAIAAVRGEVALGVLLVLCLPAAGVLMAPGSALLANAADALALPQMAVGGLGNVAWSLGEMTGAAGAGVVGTAVACAVLAVGALATWLGAVAARSRPR